MRIVGRLLIAVFVPIAVTVAAMIATMALDDRQKDDTAGAYQMARYFLREHIRQDFGADPDQFKVSGSATRDGEHSWVARGHYRPPIGNEIPWTMRLYGPFDADKWRNCELTIDGQTVFRVGAMVTCE